MAEEITCPTCDTLNDASAQECVACGAPLDAAPSHGYEFADAPETSSEEFEIEEVFEPEQAEEDFSAGYGFAVEEETQAEVAEEALYELEVESGVDEDADYELQVEPEDSTDEDALNELEVEPQVPDDISFDYPEDDEVAADGGMQLDALEDDDALAGSLGDELTVDGTEEVGAGSTQAEASEAEETPAAADAPPELAEILNPAKVAREPITALPTPGNYVEPANLRVFCDGEERGALAIDSACTVLGRALAAEDTDAFELEPSSDDFPFEDELEEEPVFDLHELSEPSEADDFAAFESEDSDVFAAESSAASAESSVADEDSDLLEEGPIIDLSQYGEASKFAIRHGYIFRQNKNYTLYVLSDMGTQLNDEMLELGARRTLTHGDVIILGGEVGLQFRAPAA